MFAPCQEKEEMMPKGTQLTFTFTFPLQVDLRLKEEDGGDISSFISNGEWDLIGGYSYMQSTTFTLK